MKAYIYEKYGPPEVLQLRELEKPVPKEGQVLVKVQATALNAYDWHLMMADPFLVRLMAGGLLKPKPTIPGADVAGVVEAVGPGVDEFKPGDEVYGDTASWGAGGCAEYLAIPQKAFVAKPANLTFEQAAAVPMAGMTALQGLRDAGQLQPGQKVLVQGAAGGVGTFAVQIAKLLGAEVTAVTSTGNLEQARALGAEHVIDYKQEDFTQNGRRYDLILGVNGFRSLAEYKRSLAPQGRYVMAGGNNKQLLQGITLARWMSEKGGRQLMTLSAKTSRSDLVVLKEYLEAGQIVPVIDRRYSLNETAEAMRYLIAGHARGKIIICP